jgi:hypothetical protein
MKKLFTLLALIVTIATFAQAPQGFNYQATVRNSSGALIVNQNVYFKFNVMLNSSTSVPVFTETHYVPTDDLGAVNLVIGQGTPTVGTFSAINWGTGNYYLGIELNAGSGYVAMGTTQLLSVPYALYANTSGSTIGNTGGFTHYIGELYGGGIVVSVWKTNGVEHGLIASLTDLGSGIPWITPAFQEIEIGSTAQSFRNGLANTNAIIAQAGVGTSYAAGLCKAYNAGGYNDWYLPSYIELRECFNSCAIVNEVLGDINGFILSSQGISYWSSTERSNNIVDVINFYEENTYGNKGEVFNAVRAIRRF